MDFMDWLNNQIEQSPLKMCIIFSTLIITVVGLALILPVALAIVLHSLWPILLYLPIIGIGLGIACYLEMY